ncbi:MAG: glycosyltransferase family 2 protein [Acidobacteriaceae bacterium]|nr:glycosyltransferase family 2 protein [Acidobacteriaceae bacterium]
MSEPLVSIITPTYGRDQFLRLLYSCVKSQDWPNFEWLIDDDSPDISGFAKSCHDERVKYHHHPSRRSVGTKRNDLIRRASGEYVVHFDDDDYYAAGYLSHHLALMMSRNLDCIKLTGFFIYDEVTSQLRYWDQTKTVGPHFVCKKGQPRRVVAFGSDDQQESLKFQLGFGFSYGYRRSVWNSVKFPDLNFCEDLSFMREAVKQHSFEFVRDTSALCCHIIHAGNTSGCFPQYVLPDFMVNTLFPLAKPYFRGVS